MARIGGVDLLDQVGEAEIVKIGKALIPAPLPGEGVDHVLGVEGTARGEARVGVEAHPVPQGEDVGPAILRDRPRFGEAGPDRRGTGGELHQRIVDLPRRVHRGGGRGASGVEGFRAALGAEDEGARRCRARGEEQGCQEEYGPHGEPIAVEVDRAA